MFTIISNELNLNYKLSDGVYKLGRRKDCDIVIPLDNVSKVHLEFHLEGQRARVRDPGSHNGTLLNDRPMERSKWYELREGDSFTICGRVLRIVPVGQVPIDRDVCSLVDSETLATINHSQSLSLAAISRSGRGEDRQLLALVKLAQGLRDVLKFDELMESTSEILLEVFERADRVAVAVKTGDQVELKWWRERQWPNDDSRERIVGCLAANSNEPFLVSRTLLAHVMAKCEAILTSDAQTDFAEAASVHALQLRSVLCAPLLSTDGVAAGVIYLDSSRGNQFSQRDFELFTAASTQLSLALNFVRLHDLALRDALIRRDVENARAIQLSYLPDSTPIVPGFEVKGFYRAARHVGGDYYDYVPLTDGCWAVLLGDVVGKGVPAALTMVRLATEARAALEVNNNAAAVLSRLNQRLSNTFITMLVVIIDPNSGEVRLSNAGHELPFLCRCDGSQELVGDECTSCPLGVLEEESYSEVSLRLAPGESLTLYSDGFPDAEDSTLNRFGRERLGAAIVENQGMGMNSIAAIVNAVDEFTGIQPQFDDMCLVQIRRLAT